MKCPFGALGRVGLAHEIPGSCVMGFSWIRKEYIGHHETTLDLLIVLDVSWLGGPPLSVHGRSSSRLTRQVDQVHDDTHDLSLKRGQVIACVDRQKAHDAGSFRVWRSKRMLGVVSPGLCSCL